MWPSKLWWVVRLALWLGMLPLRLRMYSLPRLLERMTPMGGSKGCRPIEMARLVGLVVWLCQRRLFRTALFPRACLRQALALYYLLTRLGYPARIHLGVSLQGATLHAHSWVTVAGEPVGERANTTRFQELYAFPTIASGSAAARAGLGRTSQAGRASQSCVMLHDERRDT